MAPIIYDKELQTKQISMMYVVYVYCLMGI